MKRSMTIGGRQLVLEELEEIVALPPGAPSGQGMLLPLGSTDIGAAAGCPGSATLAQEIERLTAAGWHFVRRPYAAQERGWQAAQGHAVYCDPQGHIRIDGRGLVVRLSPDIPESDAQRWLGERGLTLARKLGFQRNLFLMHAPEGMDTLSLAAELAGEDRVVYAEPQLVEVIGSRRSDGDG